MSAAKDAGQIPSPVARRPSPYTNSQLIRAFKEFDKNCDGHIGTGELLGAMKRLGVNMSALLLESDFLALLHDVDADGDGEVNAAEFCTLIWRLADGQQANSELFSSPPIDLMDTNSQPGSRSMSRHASVGGASIGSAYVAAFAGGPRAGGGSGGGAGSMGDLAAAAADRRSLSLEVAAPGQRTSAANAEGSAGDVASSSANATGAGGLHPSAGGGSADDMAAMIGPESAAVPTEGEGLAQRRPSLGSRPPVNSITGGSMTGKPPLPGSFSKAAPLPANPLAGGTVDGKSAHSQRLSVDAAAAVPGAAGSASDGGAGGAGAAAGSRRGGTAVPWWKQCCAS